jgi:hypothetical protein
LLNGTIPTVFTLGWTASGTTAFAISSTGVATNVSLGIVTATGNVPFTVKASSTTGGKLVGTETIDQTIDYTVTLAAPGTATPVTPATSPGTPVTPSLTSLDSVALTLDTGDNSGTLSPQVYADTLTLTTSAP